MSSIEKLPFKVTFDPSEHDGHRVPEKLYTLMAKLPKEVESNKRGVLAKINKNLKKYPQIPALWNYLAYYHYLHGDKDTAFSINKKIRTEFPKYVLARTNFAIEFLNRSEVDNAKAMLGESLDLATEFPNRKVFSIDEFNAYFGVVAEYYAAIGRLDKAQKQFDVYVAFNSQSAQNNVQRQQYILNSRYNEYLERKRIAEFNRYPAPEGAKQTEETPKFKHDEINKLYESGLDIEPDILKAILALPKKTLREDLKIVLEDSVNRYRYFRRLAREDKIEESNLYFPTHALALLAELGGKKNLVQLMDCLKYDEQFVRMWFSAPNFPYQQQFGQIIQGQFDLCTKFVRQTDVTPLAKIFIYSAIISLGASDDKYKKDCVAWLKDELNYFLKNKDNTEIVNIELITLSIMGLLGDLKSKTGIKLGQKFIQLDLVDINYIANENRLNEILEDETYKDRKVAFKSIYEIYNQLALQAVG